MKHFSNRNRGVITAFVAVITPVLILLVIILSDIYLAKNALIAAKNALKASCGCVLSQYSSYLKEDYCLYGYNMSEEEMLSTVLKSLEKSSIGQGLFAMEIDNIQVKPEKPLTYFPVLSEQINTIMEDDIFKQILHETNERVKVFSNLKDVISTLNVKIQIDEMIGGLKNAHILLKETTAEINSSQYYHDLMDMIRTIDTIYKDMLTHYSLMNDNDTSIAESLRQQALDILNINVDNLIYVLKQYNQKGMSLLSEMITAYADVHILSESMKRIIASINDCPVQLSAVLELCIDMVFKMEDSFKISVLEQLDAVFSRNIDCLEAAMKNMLNSLSGSDDVSIYEIFCDSFGMYCDAMYDPSLLDSFFTEVIDNTFKDDRVFLKDMADELMDSLEIEDQVIDSFISLLSDVSDEMYFFNADATNNTSRSILSSFNDMSAILSTLKEDIFLNEYILLFMNSYTDSNEYLKNDRYLDAEVEYVLFGDRDNKKNIKSCKSLVAAIRFACNAIHVYTDMQKRTKADLLSASLAGSWTFGAAAPIAKNLILCSWAIAESAYDTEILCRGGKCPVVKMDGDWHLDIGLQKGVSETPDWLKIDYEDYLRLLLCTKNNEVKAFRVLDLISLNAPNNMDISSVYSGIRICANLRFKSFLGMERSFYVEVEDSY